MSEQQSNPLHTPEPWMSIDGKIGAESVYPHIIAHVMGGNYFCEINKKANARRIVACINACAGIELSFIEALIPLNGFNSIIKGAADVSRSYELLNEELKNEQKENDVLQKQTKELEAQRDELLAAVNNYLHPNYSPFGLAQTDKDDAHRVLIKAIAKIEASRSGVDAERHQ